MSLKFWYSHESVLFFKYVTAETGFRTAGLRKFNAVAVTQFLISKMYCFQNQRYELGNEFK
jgi:hypothetical protein